MNRVLFDVNVILDVLLDRPAHARLSAAAWAAIENGAAQGLLAAHAVTTIHYLVAKAKGAMAARRVLGLILQVFDIAPVDSNVLRDAFELQCPDFEDAVTAAAARSAGCDGIVTRDLSGFRGSPVRALTPEALLPLIHRV